MAVCDILCSVATVRTAAPQQIQRCSSRDLVEIGRAELFQGFSGFSRAPQTDPNFLQDFIQIGIEQATPHADTAHHRAEARYDAFYGRRYAVHARFHGPNVPASKRSPQLLASAGGQRRAAGELGMRNME